MQHDDHQSESWAPLMCALLGIWLLASPSALGYSAEPVARSEWATGAVVLLLSLLARRSRYRPAYDWLLCLIGIWLLHAPLIFWARSAAAYLNDTVVGIALIAFSVVLPRRLWTGQRPEPEVPTGWTFNPSSWAQRTPIITLAWLNFFMARYLAAYHLGHIAWPWDPFFKAGTQQVLESEVSQAFPISDAGLGAVSYLLEALIGYMGTASRWRTAPWTVALFGVLVVPVGAVSTVLVILQPVAVGAWCSLCLVTAVFMLIMACLAVPEVVAMMQYLARRRRAGDKLWTLFWKGGEDEGHAMEEPAVGLASPIGPLFRAMVTGVTIPWGLAVTTVLGAWLVAAPNLLGIEGAAATLHVIAGAIVLVISVLALAEVLRILRFINLLVALVVLISPWLLAGITLTAQLAATAVGLALIGATLPRGRVRARYGRWERWIR
jgi:uncharacterized membrane protein